MYSGQGSPSFVEWRVGAQNPLNQAASVAIQHGRVAIPDRATFEQLSYQGSARAFHVRL